MSQQSTVCFIKLEPGQKEHTVNQHNSAATNFTSGARFMEWSNSLNLHYLISKICKDREIRQIKSQGEILLIHSIHRYG